MKIVDICEKLATARSLQEFEEALERAGYELGCSNVSGTYAENPQNKSMRYVRDYGKPPPEFDEYYDLSKSVRDPVLQLLKTEIRPIVWGQKLYADAGAGELWEEMATFGMKRGVAVSVNTSDGRRVVLGVEQDNRGPMSPVEQEMLSQAVSLLAAHAAVGAATLLQSERFHQLLEARLSDRERECLCWSAAGKTSWEIGQILTVAESTVVKHLESCMRKLKAANRVQAVALATKLGMI